MTESIRPSPRPTKLRRQRLLRRVAASPEHALDDRRCHKPDFCLEFFDVCDGKALELEGGHVDQVLEPARIGVELALKSGDPHVVNRGLGTLSHAHLAVGQMAEARQVLDDYEAQASACCSPCKGDWLRRQGDWLVESFEAPEARYCLDRAYCELRREDVDGLGRVRFSRGIARYFLGNRPRALEDEARLLADLSLASPRGYFMDAIAMMAVFLRGTDTRYDRAVLRHLDRFEGRLTGVGDMTPVRTRRRWVAGQLHARLGDFRRATDCLESVLTRLLETGPERHAAACAADLALIYARIEHDANLRSAKRVLNRCAGKCQDPALRQDLRSLIAMLWRWPEEAVDALSAWRASFVVTVPGLLRIRVTHLARSSSAVAACARS